MVPHLLAPENDHEWVGKVDWTGRAGGFVATGKHGRMCGSGSLADGGASHGSGVSIKFEPVPMEPETQM
jgi:hypothetical protein